MHENPVSQGGHWLGIGRNNGMPGEDFSKEEDGDRGNIV
jgi:hypothetical protein